MYQLKHHLHVHNTLVWLAGCLHVPFEVNTIWRGLILIFVLTKWIKRDGTNLSSTGMEEVLIFVGAFFELVIL